MSYNVTLSILKSVLSNNLTTVAPFFISNCSFFFVFIRVRYRYEFTVNRVDVCKWSFGGYAPRLFAITSKQESRRSNFKSHIVRDTAILVLTNCINRLAFNNAIQLHSDETVNLILRFHFRQD